MATRTVKTKVCDLPPQTSTRAVHSGPVTTIHVGAREVVRDVDICHAHLTSPHTFAELLDASRPAGRIQRTGRAPRTRATRDRGADIREWARLQGIEVSPRGRISRNVVQQYEASR